MKITLIDVENYKKVKKVVIAPGDRSTILIGGNNKQGKSSLLGAFSAALGGTKESAVEPIRKGEKTADIKIELDDGALIVHRRFLESGNTSLEVKSKDGKLSSPQKILDKIVGSRFIDPMKFSRLSEKEQRTVLLGCVDIGIDLDAHATERKAAYDQRTDANRDVKRFGAELESIPDPGEIPQGVDQAELLKRMDELQAYQDKRTKALGKLETLRADYTRKQKEIEDAKALVVKLEAEFDELVENGKAASNLAKEMEPNDPAEEISGIKAKLTESTGANEARTRALAAQEKRSQAGDRYEAARALAKSLDEKIQELDKMKDAALAAAKMPIPGLSIDEDKVIYNDLPLSQASGAEQLQVSLSIAAALSPELGDIWVEDGALLDDNSLELVDKFAKENNLRIWLERVGESDDDALIIEEGVIKA